MGLEAHHCLHNGVVPGSDHGDNSQRLVAHVGAEVPGVVGADVDGRPLLAVQHVCQVCIEVKDVGAVVLQGPGVLMDVSCLNMSRDVFL